MEKNDIIKLLKKLSNELNKGICLTPEEKRKMAGMGNSREEFVKTVIKVIKEDDSFLPRNYDSDKIESAYRLFLDYSELLDHVHDLRNIIHNHYVGYGTSSYQEALVIKKLLENNPDDRFAQLKKELRVHFENKTN